MRKSCLFVLPVVTLISATASGSLVTFNNASLSYRWAMHVPSFTVGNYLDITQGPSQSGASNSWGLRWEEFPLTTSSSITSMDLVGNADVRVAQSAEIRHVQINSNAQDYQPAKAFANGQVIGPGEDWQQFTTMGAHGFSPHWWFLDEGATLGVKLNIGGQTHFGFLTVAKVTDLAQQNWEYQPIAWGYESLANTPVTVPTPGTIALAGAAAIAGFSRRSRAV